MKPSPGLIEIIPCTAGWYDVMLEKPISVDDETTEIDLRWRVALLARDQPANDALARLDIVAFQDEEQG